MPKTNWFGGFYELAIELGKSSDQRLFGALNALWHHPSLEGCYLNNDIEPNQQERFSPISKFLERMHLYGLAQLPNTKKVACGSCLIREDEGSDWLDFYLPTAALSDTIRLGGFPFDNIDFVYHEWQVPLDEWLKDIATHIYAEVPFKLGLIGFEVSGEVYAADISEKGLPNERPIGYLWAESTDLKWYPPKT